MNMLTKLGFRDKSALLPPKIADSRKYTSLLMRKIRLVTPPPAFLADFSPFLQKLSFFSCLYVKNA